MRLLFCLICLSYAFSLPLLLDQKQSVVIAGGAIIAAGGLFMLIHSDGSRRERQGQSQ